MKLEEKVAAEQIKSEEKKRRDENDDKGIHIKELN